MSLLSKMPGLSVHRAETPQATEPAPPAPPGALPRHWRGVSGYGRPFALAAREADRPLLEAAYQEPVFGPEEIDLLRGMRKEDADSVLLIRSVFPEGTVERVNPVGELVGEDRVTRRVRR